MNTIKWHQGDTFSGGHRRQPEALGDAISIPPLQRNSTLMWDPTEALSQEGWLAPPNGLLFPILLFLTKQGYGHWVKARMWAPDAQSGTDRDASLQMDRSKQKERGDFALGLGFYSVTTPQAVNPSRCHSWHLTALDPAWEACSGHQVGQGRLLEPGDGMGEVRLKRRSTGRTLEGVSTLNLQKTAATVTQECYLSPLLLRRLINTKALFKEPCSREGCWGPGLLTFPCIQRCFSASEELSALDSIEISLPRRCVCACSLVGHISI